MKKVIIFGLLIHLVIAVRDELDLTHLKKSLWRSAAITIPGLFDFMFGQHPRFAGLKVKQFEFPGTIDRWECELKDERHFIEFLLRNDWVQRQVGIKMKNSNGLFPDIKGVIYDGSRTPIKVEVEYWAENYKRHGHPFGGCDLILSFFRNPSTRIVHGVPVWSFYSGKESSRIMSKCLHSDIQYDFFNTSQKEEPEKSIFDGKIWITARKIMDPAKSPKNRSWKRF